MWSELSKDKNDTIKTVWNLYRTFKRVHNNTNILPLLRMREIELIQEFTEKFYYEQDV